MSEPKVLANPTRRYTQAPAGPALVIFSQVREDLVYAKVFASMWDGSLGGNWEGWSVFVFLLANCDSEGFIEMTPEAISRRSAIPLDGVQRALELLEATDPSSRSQELEGRRLERIDAHRAWGWRIVNQLHYRHLRDPETVRTQSRLRVRQHREMKRSVTLGNARVTLGNASKRQAEAEAEAVKIESNPPSPNGSGVDLAGWKEAFEEDFWPSYPKKPEKAKALLEWGRIQPKDDDTFTAIMVGLKGWNGLWAEPSTRDRFIPSAPYAHKWLKTRRWEAEPS